MDAVTHQFGRAYEALRQAERVLLVAHKKPDGDTLGASSAVMNWLLGLDKDVAMFCADSPSKIFRFIDNIHLYRCDPVVFDGKYDVVVVFDSGDLRYAGVHEHMPRLQPGHLLINIDHHVTNERYGHLNIVLPEATSACEIVWRMFQTNNVALDEKLATSLLTGLYTDTSNFSNSATTPISIEAAADLVANGARHQEILRHLLHDKSVDLLHIWGLLLSRLSYNENYDVVSTYILNSDVAGLPNETVDGAANFLNGVVGDCDTILTLRELPGNQVKGSFRSVRRDVSKVAKLLGGGGHKKAAGFTVNGKIEVTADGPRIVDAAPKAN
ncbi:DHH family phosphoesterase [Candidatus Uhrbacteria bacterium]|nr:DHH family phosphoesterase [Candidatus Uhrbacteria bacterium]